MPTVINKGKKGVQDASYIPQLGEDAGSEPLSETRKKAILKRTLSKMSKGGTGSESVSGSLRRSRKQFGY